MIRKRLAFTVAGSIAGVAVMLAVAIVLTLQSPWFYEKVRQRIVETVADATGGRVEIGSFQFDWKRMRAEVRNFVLIGKEPAGKPPLLRAESVAVGIKIVSILKRDVDIRYLEVQKPRVYLIVYPDGSTNIPQPKTKHAGPDPMEAILKLAIGRFQLANGIFEIEAQQSTPFDLRGQDLSVALGYDRTTPSYRGEISVQKLDFTGKGKGITASLKSSVAFEKNRIDIRSAKIATSQSEGQLSGSIEDLSSPHGSFQYKARITAPDAERILNVELVDRGNVQLAGTAIWQGGSRFSTTAKMNAYNVDYRGAFVQLRGFRAEGELTADAEGIGLRSLRLAGSVAGKIRSDVSGQIARVTLQHDDLSLQGVALAVLGGSFHGQGRIRKFEQFDVTGEIAGIEARRAVALYSPEPLPWNSRVSGNVKLDGRFQRRDDLRASLDLRLDPAADSAPVHGVVSASYDARSGVIDLGHSDITLPSSRAQISGAIGRQLAVHVTTRDLNDFLPALGKPAEALPVKLQNGSASFDGTVTGAVDDPQAAGHLSATNFVFAGEKFDSFTADVTANKTNARAENGSVSHGPLHAQFQTAIDLHDWKIEDSSRIAGSGSLRNAATGDLVALLKLKLPPVAGTVDGTAQWNGTIAAPVVAADVTVARGSFDEEPFDRISAHLTYNGRTLSASDGQLAAGAKQVRFTGTYDHAPGRFDTGHLRFQVASNTMPIESIQAIHRERPEAKGSVQVTANGGIDLVAAKTGELGFRIADLHADISATQMHLRDEPLGNFHLTANSQGQVLRAHLDSDFAGSAIRGDGEWHLEGEYPGTATVTFPKTDFAQLRGWLSPSAANRFSGSLEGQLHIDGPALRPAAMKAELRITNLEVAPGKDTGIPSSLTLHNSGPVVATLSNSAVTVDALHLVGHDTDLTVGGRVVLQPKQALDLKVNGRADLAIVQTFNRDFRASGTITADATVRGTLDTPLISGRTEFKSATFSVADLPNSLSNTNGVITFTGDRATIQSFSGETGGGKVDLFGFAGYGEGGIVFRIHARITDVRVRYPEGVSTVASASLNLTGTTDRSMISGSVTIQRTGVNLESDFSSIIAQSAQPVQTPAARAGFLGGLNFDVQINTAPDIQFQSSLTQDLEVEANLRLRGTASNPALLGRINITQGQIVFFGTRYTINQGSVSFYNPIRVEPILNIDLETKARGIDITLAISGPLNKLNLTPRSDPPLQFNEIIALLATGRTPTNDPTMLAQQSNAPQSWQQMGASALLGQAIASPVAGRLQRFFGVSKLRIDPSLPGVDTTTAQARLTLEQQVTPDITFTYITNVTSSNPQVVRVEWAFSKKWSVVALREENGMFGMDFFFKRRF